ncbi:DUF4474 domain-containing protein [Ruminococcus sp. OA3]|uniref:DUF4474 domain-containing protein n=1 Tax=Ruminococcus sp. OA3 TaxID=2914164 RepID=UPI001F065B1C|nr:DUF4474 domain-containing protein [Ruminococcus sp. OA3]MCH1981700.1 DUF4474 domain-containing protein [Ruminococcus sp. OA3]
MDLNADLEEAGFAYEMNGDYFYSLMNCWQREVGYCRLYDEAAPLFNMIMDCEPVTFSYGGKRWLIELWKGQYGITTGGEIGVYNTEREDIEDNKFKGTFYENIGDDERLGLSFVLKKNGKAILRRKDLHWWLTGFKLGEFSEPNALTMDAAITFPDRQMRDAFTDSLMRIGYGRHEFSVRMKTVSIHYTKPHSPQTESRNKVRAAIVQKTNHSNCYLYETATREYSHTLDKLEYIKAMVPELYTLFMDSLYAKGIYEAFGWIKDWLGDKKPHPGPKPPRPPEPPEPPCLPCPPCPPEPPCSPCPPCPPCPPKPLCPPEPECEPCRPTHHCRPCHSCEPCPPRREHNDCRHMSVDSHDDIPERQVLEEQTRENSCCDGNDK